MDRDGDVALPHHTTLATIEDLEAALQAHWCRETLAVYADGLQSIGDPRGELIALDLHIEAHGLTPALEATRRERLHAWLGGTHLCGRPWHPELFQFGFLDDLYIASDARPPWPTSDVTRAFLASPASDYLRGVKIAGAADELAEALAMLATRRHRWLEYLSITQLSIARRPMPARIVEALFAVAPRLHTLELDGRRIFEPIMARSLRRLELRGPQAIVFGDGAMSSVTELELGLSVLDEPPDFAQLAALLDRSRLPHLRDLDLARNEPMPSMYPHHLDAFELVDRLEDPGRLERIRLPSVRTVQHANTVRALVHRAPDTQLEIARGYRAFQHLCQFGRLRVRLPECRPWPPLDSLSQRTVTITIPPDGTAVRLSLAECVAVLEDDFDAMSGDRRLAWTKLWQFLQADESRFLIATFSATTLLTALEALDDLDVANGTFGPWRAAGELLRRRNLPPGTLVTIAHAGTPTFARPRGSPGVR